MPMHLVVALTEPPPAFHGLAADLARWPDEELVAGFQKYPWQPFWEALEVRHRPWRNQYVAGLATRWHLPAEDVADAQEDAVVSMRIAIRNYKFAVAGTRKPKPFRAFLALVVWRRFHKFAHGWQKTTQPDAATQGSQAASSPAAFSLRVVVRRGLEPFECTSPLDDFIRREEEELLGAAAQRLVPELRRVWDGVVAGLSQQQLALELKLTRKQLRLRIRELMVSLRAIVGFEDR